MKTIKWLNGIVIGLPLLMVILSIKESGYLLLGALFFSFTGIFQVFIALRLYANNLLTSQLKLYFAFVIVFFIGWISLDNLLWGHDYMHYYVFGIPIIPAFYLTYLIHKI